MKEYYYFQVGTGYNDLVFILKELWREFDTEDRLIWKRRLSRDTHKIRVDSAESKVLKAMFR
jgi:hypothetical protein